MGFDYPWVFALLAAIVPLLWILRKSELLTRSIVGRFHSLPPTMRYFRLRYGLAAVFTGALILAGAGPYIEPSRTADILFLVDTSRSMHARNSCDEPTFLDRAKNVMRDIMASVPEARYGVVAFDRLAFPITQLTYDHSWLDVVIEKGLFVGMAYRATDTEMMNALSALAAKKQALPDLYQNVRYVVMLSDGHLNEDDWRQNLEQPLKDLEAADITLLVVGIGNPVETPVPLLDDNGICSGTMAELNGNPVRISLRTDILQTVANGTQGIYYDEASTGELIDELRDEALVEVTGQERFGAQQRRNISSVFLYPATAALFGLFLL